MTVPQINTEDAEGVWRRALDAEAAPRHELADALWGERHGQLMLAERARASAATAGA